MKITIICFLALGGLGLLGVLASCTTVEQREPVTHTTSTTTEQTTVRNPVSNTVQTRTTRNY